MSMKWCIIPICLGLVAPAFAGEHDKDWQIASQARQITKLQTQVSTLVHENAQLKAENTTMKHVASNFQDPNHYVSTVERVDAIYEQQAELAWGCFHSCERGASSLTLSQMQCH